MSAEPKASKIVSVQLAFGKDDPRTLEEITASVKDWLGQLDPKRITIMDEYWLVDGVRTTRAGLSSAGDKPATEPATPVVSKLPTVAAQGALAKRACTGGCGTTCTKDNADRNDDGSWTCWPCQKAA